MPIRFPRKPSPFLPQKQLNRLSALSFCIETPVHRFKNKKLQKIEKVFRKATTFLVRTFFLVIYREWFNNKKASLVAKHYVFQARSGQRSDKRTKKIQRIFEKLTRIQRPLKGTPYLHGMEKEWITTNATDDGYTLRRVKPVSSLDTRQLFHIHANAFGANNHSLEGSTSEHSLSYLHAFLEKRCEQKLSTYQLPSSIEKAIKEAAQQEIDINKKQNENERKNAWTERTRQRIEKGFAEQTPTLLSGGWAGAPGHAIYYEVIPENDSTATLRLCNLGAGSSEHERILYGNKTKTLPYFDLTSIAKERLLDPHVLQAFSELVQHAYFPSSSTKTEYDSRDIYQGLCNLLKASPPPSYEEVPVDAFKTTQSSGICAWRSLLAYLSTHIPKEEYKRLVLDIRLQSLVDRASHIKNKTDLQEWRLVKKSEEKLYRKLTKASNHAFVGKQYILHASYQLRKVSDWLEREKGCQNTGSPNLPQKRAWELRSAASECNITATPSLEEMARKQHATTEPSYPYSIRESVEQCRNAPTLDAAIDHAYTLKAESEKMQDTSFFHLFMIEWLKDEERPFTTHEPKEAQQYMMRLGELAKAFMASCFQTPAADVIHTEKIYVLFKLLALQENLSHVAIRTSFPPINFDLGEVSPFKKLPFLNLHDKKWQKKFDDLARQLYGLGIGRKHFYCENHSFSGDRPVGESSSLIFFRDHITNRPQGILHQHLLDLFPNEVNHFFQRHPQMIRLSKTLQCAHFYASDDLPKWFQSLRDTHFHLLHLCHEPVGQIEGKIDLSFHFKVESINNQYDPEAKITFGLNGVTGDLLNENPSLIRSRKQPKWLFHNHFRPFESKQMEAFFHYIVKHSSSRPDEKTLLADHVAQHNIPLSDEWFKELAHLFTSKTLQLSKALGFFMQHAAKLQDPDYQTLFEILFFRPPLLEEISTKNSDFGKRLQTFIEGQIHHSIQENDLFTAVFLLRMSRHFKGFFPAFADTEATLQRLIKKENLDIEERSLIFAEWMALQLEKKTLPEDQVTQFLQAIAFIHDHPLPGKWTSPTLERAVQTAPLFFADTIRPFLLPQDNQPNVTALNTLSKAVVQKEGLVWQVNNRPNHFPSFFAKQGETTIHYFPLEGEIVSPNKEVLLPTEICENPSFKLLFGDAKKAVLLQKNLYRLTDRHGNECLIRNQPKSLDIEQKRDGEWYRFIPRSAFYDAKDGKIEAKFHSRHLLQNFQQWQSVRHPRTIEFLDVTQGTFLYSASLDQQGQITNVRRKTDGYLLGQSSSLFHHFEEPECIQEWYDEQGTLREVELPRYSLSFTHSESTGSLFCTSPGWQGYHLAKDQEVPFLGSFSHRMVLENKAGERKILLAQQWAEKLEQSEDKESLKPYFSLNRNTGLEQPFTQKLYCFDQKENGELLSREKAAHLQLIYALMLGHEYRAANDFLRRFGSKLNAYTEEEARILEEIVFLDEKTGDQDPNVVSLQLFAGYLLYKQKNDHHQETPPHLHQAIKKLYSQYLSGYSNVTALQFSPSEEIFLLQTLLDHQIDSSSLIRLMELDPLSAQRYSMPIFPSDKGSSSLLSFSFQKNLNPQKAGISRFFAPRDEEIKASYLRRQDVLITRFGKLIGSHFYSLYDIARNGTEEQKKWLKEALSFFSHQPGSPWGCLFSCILDHPDAFPSPPTEDKKVEPWWKDLLATADRVGGDHLRRFGQQRKFKKTSMRNETPDHFSLNPQETTPPPLTIAYQFPSIPSLSSHCGGDHLFASTTPKEEGTSAFATWLEREKSSSPIRNPLYREHIQNVKRDDDIFHQIPKQPIYSLQQGAEKTIKELVQLQPSKEERCTALQKAIIEKANQPPAMGAERVLFQMQQKGGTQRILTMNELLILYARKDVQTLAKRNPSLSEKEIQALFDDMGAFLITKTQEQQRARARTEWERYQHTESPDERDAYLQSCATLLLAERAYDPKEKPAYLVFEYFADILIRPDQIEKLDTFLNAGDTNPVMEMIMGFGKSKVLLPLLAFLRADGKAISTLVIPDSLFASIASDTESIVHDAFGQIVRAIHSVRNTTFSPHHLRTLLQDIKTVQKEKGCLAMTGKSILCFLLKYLEKCEDHLNKQEYPEELQLMEEILRCISQDCLCHIEEADLLLRVLHEICFSVGKRESPIKADIETLSHLYTLLYTDPIIKALAKVNSDPSPTSGAPVLTKELYEQTFKRQFAERLIASFSAPNKATAIASFFGKQTEDQKKMLVDYLTHDKENRIEAQKYFDQQTEEIQDFLALAAEEISQFLPHTLTRLCDENYGIDHEKNGVIGIPFSAANTPSTGSQFCSPYVTMNYTYQYYALKGVSQQVLADQVARLQERAIKS